MKAMTSAALVMLSLFSLGGCATGGTAPEWTTLIDGVSGLDKFNQVGVANWSATGGAVQADQGGKDPAFLVTRQAYQNFTIHAEFWASADANSGIFLRCQEPQQITANNCYEVNIYDQRPEPSYGTGAIVNVARVEPMPKAGGKWNTFDISAQGTRLVVVLNGVKTVDVDDSKLASGVIGLQWGAGTIKFRKVQIRAL